MDGVSLSVSWNEASSLSTPPSCVAVYVWGDPRGAIACALRRGDDASCVSSKTVLTCVMQASTGLHAVNDEHIPTSNAVDRTFSFLDYARAKN